MAARGRKQDEITRADLLSAISDLKTQLLDTEAPSLLTEVRGLKSQMDEHADRVEAIAQDFTEFKLAYAADRGRVKGAIAVAGVAGGGVMAAIKHFFLK